MSRPPSDHLPALLAFALICAVAVALVIREVMHR